MTTNAPQQQIRPRKARLDLLLLASGTIFFCDAHSMYLDTSHSASQREIAPDTQVHVSSSPEVE
jgi:hypothetical protein